MKRVVEAYYHFLKGLIALCLAIMVVLVFGNVVLRYGFNTGITVSEEVSRWLFVYLTFLGAIVALREHGHLGVNMMVSRLSRTGKKVCYLLTQLMMLGVTGLLLYGSWEQTAINMGVVAPASGASVGIFYAVGVWFAISTGLIILHDLWRFFTGKVTDEELVMVTESEEEEELKELQKELEEQERLDPSAGGGVPPTVPPIGRKPA